MVVLVEREADGVVIVTLNRPKVHTRARAHTHTRTHILVAPKERCANEKNVMQILQSRWGFLRFEPNRDSLTLTPRVPTERCGIKLRWEFQSIGFSYVRPINAKRQTHKTSVLAATHKAESNALLGFAKVRSTRVFNLRQNHGHLCIFLFSGGKLHRFCVVFSASGLSCKFHFDAG